MIRTVRRLLSNPDRYNPDNLYRHKIPTPVVPLVNESVTHRMSATQFSGMN